MDKIKVFKSSEHIKGEYNIDGKKGLGHYGYMFINHETLGDFFVSCIKVNKELIDIRTDGYPWQFLADKENLLNDDQKRFVEENKKTLFTMLTNEL